MTYNTAEWLVIVQRNKLLAGCCTTFSRAFAVTTALKQLFLIIYVATFSSLLLKYILAAEQGMIYN